MGPFYTPYTCHSLCIDKSWKVSGHFPNNIFFPYYFCEIILDLKLKTFCSKLFQLKVLIAKQLLWENYFSKKSWEQGQTVARGQTRPFLFWFKTRKLTSNDIIAENGERQVLIWHYFCRFRLEWKSGPKHFRGPRAIFYKGVIFIDSSRSVHVIV